jgi:hypothetical protein
MNSGIKKTLLALCFLCGLTGAASAQMNPSGLSTPEHVAMVFYKLTRQIPDFHTWARETQAVKTAPPLAQETVASQKAQELRDAYALLTTEEPIAIETQAQISDYNAKSGGFFIENFTSQTYFSAAFNGQHYALVPRGILDSQWVGVANAENAKAIDTAAAATPNRVLRLVIYLTPKTADKSSPLMLDGADHWLIETAVKSMTLYDAKGEKILWQSGAATAEGIQKNQLLNLYGQPQ